mgnify:CR=1 FL=1
MIKKQIRFFFKKNKRKLQDSTAYFVDKKLKNTVSQTVIINGFWRSGTTLLQTKICKSIRGKSVFEPFGPDVANDSLYKNSKLEKSNLSRNFIASFMPFCDKKNSSSDFNLFINNCFNSNMKSSVIRRLRQSIKSSFSKIVVCKIVRGHLLLPYLLEQYPKTPIIHIYRNPKAVIASITRKGWGYWFKDFYIGEHFINIDDGREEYFNQFENLIKKYDNKDVLSRICAFWCLVERYIQDKCIGSTNFLYISYEYLITNGFEPVEEFLIKFVIEWQDNKVENLNSATTNYDRKIMSKEQKRDSWKRELDFETQRKIDLILEDFGLNTLNF